MRNTWLLIPLMVVAIALSASAASSKKKKSDSDSSASSQPSAEGKWHKVTSRKNDAKVRATLIKFQPTTDKFRVTIVAKGNTDGVASQLRAELMEETVRDQDGVPRNWKEVEPLCEGEPKKLDPMEFTGGLNKDGKPKWFAISVSGQKTHYEITIEDQGTGKAKDSEE
jgi:hypothetical protein